MLESLALDIKASAALVILYVQLITELGWDEWTAKDLQDAEEVQTAAKLCSPLRELLGRTKTNRGAAAIFALFGRGDGGGASARGKGDATTRPRTLKAAAAAINEGLRAFIADEQLFGAKILRGLRDEERRQRELPPATCLCGPKSTPVRSDHAHAERHGR